MSNSLDRNKKIALITILAAIVLVIALLVVLLVKVLPQGNASQNAGINDTTAGIDGEGFVPVVNEKPTTEPLTAENSLDLGKMQIVLPEAATALEQSASTELASYIKKMTGEELEMVTEGQEGDAGIYIGATKFAQENNVTYPSTEFGEGWAIKVVGNDLILCGEAKRGPLFAVYHLLEDALGVRWWTFTEEYVPALDAALLWDQYDDSGAPAFEYRDIFGENWAWTANMFSVRNRLNGWCSTTPAAFGGMEYYGGKGHVHTMDRYITPDYYADHPDWFAMDATTGIRQAGSLLCLTNEELLETFTEMFLADIAADCDDNGVPKSRYYSISAADTFGFCACEKCTESVRIHGGSGYMLIFVNAIAEKVAEKYPNVYVDTLAYLDYVDVPLDDTRPADNVVIRFADIFTTDLLHSFDHVNNEKFITRIKQWGEITKPGNLYLWDYMKVYDVNGPFPSMYNYANNMQLILQSGVVGYFGEFEACITTDFWEMKYWITTKLLEDPYQDIHALIEEFANGYYGAAGEYVLKYLDLMHELASESTLIMISGSHTDRPQWLSYEHVIAAEGYFTEALRAANGDNDIIRRVELARAGFDRAVINNYNKYQKQAEEAGVAFDIDKIVVLKRLIKSMREQVEMRGSFDSNAADHLADLEYMLTRAS